jgi:hypothetical protein
MSAPRTAEPQAKRHGPLVQPRSLPRRRGSHVRSLTSFWNESSKDFMNNGPALMGAGGNDMSSLEPNSGGDEDGKTRPSKSCHHVEPTPPLHKPLLVQGARRPGGRHREQIPGSPPAQLTDSLSGFTSYPHRALGTWSSAVCGRRPATAPCWLVIITSRRARQ